MATTDQHHETEGQTVKQSLKAHAGDVLFSIFAVGAVYMFYTGFDPLQSVVYYAKKNKTSKTNKKVNRRSLKIFHSKLTVLLLSQFK